MPENYKKGTIKIKTVDEQLVPFMPNTDISSVKNISTGTTLSQKMANLNSRITDAAGKGGIKVMYEEPTAANTVSFGAKTLIGYVLPETWSFTINTTYWGDNFNRAEVPFSLYGTQDASINIYWGDGTSTTYTSNDAAADRFPQHSYDAPGEYSIRIESYDFERIYIDTFCGDWEDFWYYGSRMFSLQLKAINSPLPKLAGVISKWTNNGSVSCEANSFSYLFNYFNNLVSIPSDLFKCNPHITNFAGCFNYCTNLASIPNGLFNSNTAATNFQNCFSGCYELQSIPSGLFASNASAADFSLCFQYCQSLGDFTLHIGSSLVSNCDYFVSKKTNAVRTIYVPSGSTTQTTFNNSASSMGLTVIGE